MIKIEENIATKSRKSNYTRCIEETIGELKITQSFMADLKLISESTLRQVVSKLAKKHQIRLRVEKMNDFGCRVFRVAMKDGIVKKKIKRSSFLWIKNHPGTAPRVLANQLAQEGDSMTVDQVKHIMENLDVYDIHEDRVPPSEKVKGLIKFKTSNGMSDDDVIVSINRTEKTNITQEDVNDYRGERGALW